MPAIYAFRHFRGGRRPVAGWRLHRTYSQGRQASPNCRSRKSTKVELIINLNTAKVIGLTMPPPLIALCRRGDRMKLLLRCMRLEVAPFGSVAQFPRCLQIDLKRASRQGPCWSENEPDRTLHCYSLAAEYKNSATTAP